MLVHYFNLPADYVWGFICLEWCVGLNFVFF